MFAAMVSSDAVIESIASELNGHLMGEHGAGSDANQKTRDYVRNDGPELFMDYIKKLRSEKMGEVFIRG
jgi:FAD/FMN-containing dehydrogenase